MGRTLGSKDKKTTQRKRKPNTGQFKPGNKLGRRAKGKTHVTQTLEKVANQKVDKALVDKFLTFNSHLTPNELLKKLKVKPVSILEGMLIKGMLKAFRTGDPHNIDFILNRLIGKVPTRIAHSLDNELQDLTEEQLLERKRQYAEALGNDIQKDLTRPGVVHKLNMLEKVEFKQDEVDKAIEADIIKGEMSSE